MNKNIRYNSDTHYACYLPRGYSGVTWKKLDAPVTDSAEVEKANRESMRDEAIYHFIEDSKKENGNIILLGGDFNEPSHLDRVTSVCQATRCMAH